MNWQIIVGILFLLGGLANITQNFGAFLFGLSVGAILLYFGLKKNGLLYKIKEKFTKTSAIPSDRSLNVETFQVVGEYYYKDNIQKLACKNSNWSLTAAQLAANGQIGSKIYRYNYINKPVRLIEEPNNEHDLNAVMVMIAGEKVGYISREDNVHVKDILARHEVKYISSFISGGQYKIISEDLSISRFEDEVSITVRIGYV